MKINNISFRIKTDAVGKQRPKFSTRKGFVNTYTPKKTKEQEELIRTEFIKHFGNEYSEFDGPILITIKAGYKIPKSCSKKEINKMLLYSFDVRKKPDIDNVVKLILDALNGIAFKDDKQVCEVTASKVWMTEPETVIKIGYCVK